MAGPTREHPRDRHDEQFESLSRNLAQTQKKVVDAFKGFAEGTAFAGIALNQMSELFGRIGNQVSQFVGALEPATVLRFNLAVTDTKAAIGSALLPVMKNFTEVVRQIGNLFASLDGPGKALVAGLASMAVGMGVATALTLAFNAAMSTVTGGLTAVIGGFVGLMAGMIFSMKDAAGVSSLMSKAMGAITAVMNGLGRALIPVAEALDPVVTALTDVFAGAMGVVASAIEAAVPYIKVLADMLSRFIRESVIPAIQSLAAWLGLDVKQFDMKDSTGMGVRNVRGTDTAGLIAMSYQGALRLGKGQDPNEQTASNTAAMLEAMKIARAKIEEIAGYAKEIRDKLVNAGNTIVQAAQDAYDNPQNVAIGAALAPWMGARHIINGLR